MTRAVITVTALQPVFVKFLRFALVGLMGTGVHYSVLWLLVELAHGPVLLATTIGFGCGAVVNYIMNHRFTFASDEKHVVALPKFMTIAALGAVFNALIVAWLLQHTQLHYLVIQLFATGIVLLWNFAANAAWTFRK